MEAWLPPAEPAKSVSSSTPTEILAKQSSVNTTQTPEQREASLAVNGIVTSRNNSSTKVTAADVEKALDPTSSGKVDVSNISGINGVINSNPQKLTLEGFTAGTSLPTGNVFGELNTAIKSISGTFSKAATDLAGSVNKALSTIFKDTNVKAASTVNTSVSDPVKTLLEKNPPKSDVFKIGSLESGSQVITLTGISKEFGSKASEMISTDLSTLIDRFNLDAKNGLGKALESLNRDTTLKSLTSDVSKLTKDVSGLVNTIQTTKNDILNTTNTALRTVTTDIQSFLGRTDSLSRATGISVIDNFTADISSTLMTEFGVRLDTRSSGVNASVGNALLDLARYIKCEVPAEFYRSANEIDSLFRTLIDFASRFNMDDLLGNLLDCTQASSSEGQISIINSIMNSSATDATTTETLIDAVDNKELLDATTIYENLLTNPKTSLDDIGTLSSISTKLGVDLKEGYLGGGRTVSGDLPTGDISVGYPVYDSEIVSKSNYDVASSVLGSPTLPNYYQGTEMALDSSGTWI